MTTKFKNYETTFKRYLKDKSGQFAIWFGVAAFPVLVATSMALDFRSTESSRDAIKQALDVAVLASVSNETTDNAGKQQLAKDIFNTHFTGDVDLLLDVTVSDGRVEMNAKGTKEATLSRAIGNKGFSVNETSIAEMTRQNTICVLSLAEEGQDKLRFLGDTEFNSPTCSVQSNSRDDQGMLSATRSTPIAKSFCTAGGATGDFKPSVRGECRVVEDPYKDREVPNSGVCMPTDIFADPDEDDTTPKVLSVPRAASGTIPAAGHEPWVEIRQLPGSGNVGRHSHEHCHVEKPTKCHVGNHRVETLHMPSISLDRLEGLGVTTAEANRLVADYDPSVLDVQESGNYTGDDSVFFPGTYCGGLTVDGQNVTFMPGIYIMKDGPLTFKNGASAFAEDVSFVLKGESSVVTVESDSYVWVKSPRDGAMAGMAFYQDRNGDSDTAITTPVTEPTALNLISSGGELNVTGTMYFPTQALDVTGDSVLGARAPATSFIAHQVTFAGNTRAAISVDYVKGKIPPMEPRSDDGARLIE